MLRCTVLPTAGAVAAVTKAAEGEDDVADAAGALSAEDRLWECSQELEAAVSRIDAVQAKVRRL